MSSSKPPESKDPAPADKPGEDKKSGRVGYDSRGNPIWEWQIKTGVFGRDIDTKRMKKLEAPDLKIVDDPPPAKSSAPQAPGKTLPRPRQAGGGMDPYNSDSGPVKNNKVVDQMMGQKTQPTPAPKPEAEPEPKSKGWFPFGKKKT